MKIKTFSYAFLAFMVLVQSVLLGGMSKTIYAEEIEMPEAALDSYLVISAVQITGGTGKTHEDFIELFNPTSEPFNLNGHRIVKRTAAGASDSLIKLWDHDAIVEPYHFYLWANVNFAGIAAVPDSTSSATLADNNGIALRFGDNDSGEIIDSMAWGSTANGFVNKSLINPSASHSLVRSNLLEVGEFIVSTSSPRNSSAVLLPQTVDENEVDVPESEPEENDNQDEPSEESGIETEVEEEAEVGVVDIIITEILPNPSGADAGFEKIELFNRGAKTVSLAGYKLDDAGENEGISSNAYTLPLIEIEPGEYKEILIPSGKFTLNNTGGDIVSIFTPSNTILNSMSYTDSAPENKSYSLFNSGWKWSDSTFGKPNGNPPVSQDPKKDVDIETENETVLEKHKYDNSGLQINEIFPHPSSGEKEFVEIYNSGSKSAQLAYVSLYVGDRKKLLPEYELEPYNYFVVEQEFLPVQLRNSGQVLKLQEGDFVLSEVTYPVAIQNASFARFEDGFLWTTNVTKSIANILDIPEVVKKQAVEAAKKTATASNKTPAKAAAVKTSAQSAKKPEAVSETKLEQLKPEANQSLETGTNSENIKKQKESLGKIIAMGAAAVTAGIIALYKFVLIGSAE